MVIDRPSACKITEVRQETIVSFGVALQENWYSSTKLGNVGAMPAFTRVYCPA